MASVRVGCIFSGSAVVDWRNSSGFGADGKPPLVAIFTYHHPELAKAGGRNREYQGIAYSTDRGRSWTQCAGNPVLPNPGGGRLHPVHRLDGQLGLCAAGAHPPLAGGIPASQTEWILEFQLPDAVGCEFGIELSNDLGERYRFG